MKKTSKAKVTLFHDADFPNMASHCPQSKCGFSIYKGVLVQWDEDEDERILTFIDQLPEGIRIQLLVAQEHEGLLGFLWRAGIPKGFESGGNFKVEGDEWNVWESWVPGGKESA